MWRPARSGASQESFFHGCLAAVIEHLTQDGLTESRIRCLRASVRHFLAWLGQEDIDISVIDDAVLRRFRRHDCRCPRMERARRKMLAEVGPGSRLGALRPRPRRHPEYSLRRSERGSFKEAPDRLLAILKDARGQ